MKRLELWLVVAAAGWLLPPGIHAADNSAQPAAEAMSAEDARAMTAGLVKKVDKAVGKVTISHEPIENLGMPKMTMIFRVKDPAMLDRLKEGDRIRFVAETVNGLLTVMEFESAK